MRNAWIFLAGLTGGLLLGILFAPQSGVETQELIGRKAQDGIDQIGSRGRKIGAQVRSAVAKGRDRVSDAMDAGRETISEA